MKPKAFFRPVFGTALLAALLALVLAAEWRRQSAQEALIADRERSILLRQKALRLERELLLVRSDEAEILSAGRDSLRRRVETRQRDIEQGLRSIAPALRQVFDESQNLDALIAAVERYRNSVNAELDLARRIGKPQESGLVADLDRLEQRLLSATTRPDLRQRLLKMQVQQWEYVSSLQTSSAIDLLAKVDALRAQLADQKSRGTDLANALDDYRRLVEQVMAASLEMELARSESSLRFQRLQPMFRELEDQLDSRLEVDAARIDRLRGDRTWQATAFLAVALLVLAMRVRYERLTTRRTHESIRRLAAGMQAFADGAPGDRLDLPESGDLGRVSAAFLTMAERIRRQISTIDQERRRAEEAVEVKSDFLARVSHELRTPLNGILGMAELLQTSGLEANKKHLVETIQRSGSTLLSVVNDLLDFSRIEAGKLELEIRSIDLADMLEGLIEMHAPSAHSKGLELVLTYETEVAPRVEVDPLRLSQILTNLLGNAIKFTQEGEVELEIRQLVPLAAGRARLEMVVRDTGPGIPPHLHEHIFQPFSQGESFLRRRHGGSGLGLSIVQQLVTLMGGSVRLEAQKAGAHFFLQVDVGLSEEAAAPPDRPLEGKHILAVDAHLPSLRALVDQLGRAGARVEQRSGAEDALTDPLAEIELAVLGHQAAGAEPRLAELEANLRKRDTPVLHTYPTVLGQGENELPDRRLPRPPRYRALVNTAAQALGSAPLARGAGAGSETEDDTPNAKPMRFDGRILLAEDNPVNRELVVLMLEGSGCELVTVENGQEAVDRVASETFDLVLMDCHMPILDGYQATRSIRLLDEPDRARVPIVALTASAFESDRRRCLEAGMDEVISKPASLEMLSACLSRFLGQSDEQALSSGQAG